MKEQTSSLKISHPQWGAKSSNFHVWKDKQVEHSEDNSSLPVASSLWVRECYCKKKPRQWVIGCLMNCIGRPCSVEGWVCHRALGAHSRAALYWLLFTSAASHSPLQLLHCNCMDLWKISDAIIKEHQYSICFLGMYNEGSLILITNPTLHSIKISSSFT